MKEKNPRRHYVRFTKLEDAKLLDVLLLPKWRRAEAYEQLAKELNRSFRSVKSRALRLNQKRVKKSVLNNMLPPKQVKKSQHSEQYLDIKVKKVELLNKSTLRIHF